MKEFKYYIIKKSVKKQAPDANTAKATARTAIERISFAKSIINTHKSKFVLENAYESAREYLDAILYLKGYKSYSHEATIAFAHENGLTITEAKTLDNLRKQRHGIKYYGEETTNEEAILAIQLAEKTIRKLSEKFPELKRQ